MWTQSSTYDNFPTTPEPKPARKKASPPATSAHQPVGYSPVGTGTDGPSYMVALCFGAVLALGCYIFGGANASGSTANLGAGSAVKITDATAKASADRNNPAPARAGQMTDQEVQSYVDRFATVAQEEQKKFGIPACISLAQGLIESRAGTSGVAVECNNHFGIKCFSQHHKGCCMKFRDDNNNDSFRRFAGAWGSWREHSKLLSSGRYKVLHDYGLDYKAWARGLKQAGYATAKNYDQYLVQIIERYHLDQYDLL